MKTHKQILSLILALALCLGMLPTGVLAAGFDLDSYFGDSSYFSLGVSTVTKKVATADRDKFLDAILAQETVSEEVRSKIYNLLFKAQYRPDILGGTDNKKYPSQNGGTYTKKLVDSKLGTITWNETVGGCYHYALAAISYIYGTPQKDGSIDAAIKDKRLDGYKPQSGDTKKDIENAVKKVIHEKAVPGTHIRFNYRKDGTDTGHSVVYLGEDNSGKGFYYLSYLGGGEPDLYLNRIYVDYTTYYKIANSSVTLQDVFLDIVIGTPKKVASTHDTPPSELPKGSDYTSDPALAAKLDKIFSAYPPNTVFPATESVNGVSIGVPSSHLHSRGYQFARWCFYKLFGYVDSVEKGESGKYTFTELLTSSQGKNQSVNELASLLKKGLSGTACGSHLRISYYRSYIVLKVSDSGITVLDADKNGDGKVWIYDLTYAELAKVVKAAHEKWPEDDDLNVFIHQSANAAEPTKPASTAAPTAQPTVGAGKITFSTYTIQFADLVEGQDKFRTTSGPVITNGEGQSVEFLPVDSEFFIVTVMTNPLKSRGRAVLAITPKEKLTAGIYEEALTLRTAQGHAIPFTAKIRVTDAFGKVPDAASQTTSPSKDHNVTPSDPPEERPTAPIVIVSTGIDPESSGTAIAMPQKVQVGNQTVELQSYALAANGGVTNYVKLRDLADLLDGTAAQFNVTWSKEAGVGLETGAPYISRNGTEGVTNYSGDQFYQRGASTTNVDGIAVSLQCFALQNGAYTYYKLRDLGQALNFNVGWSQERGVFIEPDRPYDPDN